MRIKNQLIFLIFLVIFWGVFVFTFTIIALPYNPVSFSENNSLSLKALMPEGWSFFTRSPREPRIKIYKRENNCWVPFVIEPNSSSANLFGLMKTARAQSYEYSVLLENFTDEKYWVQCEGDVVSYLDQDVKIQQVINSAPNPTFLGMFWFVFQEPVPWAWRNSNINMPSKMIKLNVISK